MRRYITACERAKRMLTSSTGATVEAFVGEHEAGPTNRSPFQLNLTRFVLDPTFINP